jgi:uncharacterized membrane protein YuzA (DUF378 family)
MTRWQLKVRAQASRDLGRLYAANRLVTPRKLDWQYRRLMLCYRQRSLVALAMVVLVIVAAMVWRDTGLFSLSLAAHLALLLFTCLALFGWLWYDSLVRWAPVIYAIYAQRCEKATMKNEKRA